MAKVPMTIGHKEFMVDVKDVKVTELRFYALNPRVYSVLNSDEEAEPDQATIFNHMKSLEHTKELKASIQMQGLLTPLIVYKDSIVVEGNSRLAAYRLLWQSEPERWEKVRCYMLPPEVTDDDIFTLLAIRHINGQKDWEPIEQGGFLYRRLKETRRPVEAIAAGNGITPGVAKKLVTVYEMMVNNEDLSASRWSYYDELNKIEKKIRDKEHARPNLHIREYLLTQIKVGGLPDAQSIRKIGKILASASPNADNAIDGYCTGELSIDEAYTKIEDQNVLDSIKKQTKLFREVVLRDDYKDFITNDEDLKFITKRIYNILKAALEEQ